MNHRNRGANLIELFRYLGSLWGLMSAASLFFPLSSRLLSLIPLQSLDTNGDIEAGFIALTPPLVTVLATVLTLFSVLIQVAERDSIEGLDLALVKRRAWLSMIGSVGSLALYLLLFHLYSGPEGMIFEHNYGWRKTSKAVLPKPFEDYLLLALYTAFFALMTRAFMLLALKEYFRART